MLNVEELKRWAWFNLQFYNVPENVDDTFVDDIINGYSGTCHDVDGHALSYSEIRAMFTEYDDDDDEEE